MNKLFIIKTILFTVGFMLSLQMALAQHSQTLYYMQRLPQSTQMNPALQPACNVYIGLPAINSIQVAAGNDRLTLADVILKHPTQDSLMTFLHPLADKDAFLNQLKDKNSIFEQFHTNLFYLGFRVNDWYVGFNISDRQQLLFTYPKDLATFLLKGNDVFENTTMDLTALNTHAMYFREYGLALSKKVGAQWTFGVRPKLLFGKGYIDTEVEDLSFYWGTDSVRVNGDARVNVSAPVDVKRNDEGDFDGFEEREDIDAMDYALSSNNMGFAIDLGATYNMNRFNFSASIVDLGFIKWKDEVTQLSVDGAYDYTGFDVTSEFDDEVGGDPFDDVLDSLENEFDVADKSTSFTSGLGTKIYAGAQYQLTERIDMGFLSRTRVWDGKVNQAFTLSANTRPLRGLSFSLSYSIMDGTYNNLGAGLILGGAPFQLYIISDNLSAGLWGHKTSAFNFRFGLNLAFGCKKKIKDMPMIQSKFIQ